MWQSLIASVVKTAVSGLIGLIPDKRQATEAEQKMVEQITKAVIDISAQQNRINEIEAGHKSIFVAGWRPFIGWVCGLGLAYEYLFRRLLDWVLVLVYKGSVVPPPALDTTTLYQLVLAMLGLGTMRLYEKVRGVSREVDPHR